MNTRGRQADDNVAGTDVCGVDHLGAIDNAHGKACQIVIVRTHDAGVLGHLATHEGAAREFAAIGHTLHDLCHVLGLDLTDCHVVEEEQRLGAGSENVVYAHGNKVLAHRLVTVEQLCQHELGAHAIGARNKNRVFHVLKGGGGEQTAKAANTANDLGAIGLLNHLLDGVDRATALGRIDAGVLVRHVLGILAHRISFRVERFGKKRHRLQVTDCRSWRQKVHYASG